MTGSQAGATVRHVLRTVVTSETFDSGKEGRTVLRITLAAIAMIVTGGAGALAQDHRDLGSFNDWIAYQYEQGGGTRCTMASQPKKDQGDYSRRGEIWAFVMHRPDEGASGEVGFHMGYPIKDGSQVTVEIGGTTYSLYTQGEGAFAYRDDEPGLIRSMRRGATMTVSGTSSRGTKTTDTYSLSGFTAAKQAIDSACNVN